MQVNEKLDKILGLVPDSHEGAVASVIALVEKIRTLEELADENINLIEENERLMLENLKF